MERAEKKRRTPCVSTDPALKRNPQFVRNIGSDSDRCAAVTDTIYAPAPTVFPAVVFPSHVAEYLPAGWLADTSLRIKVPWQSKIEIITGLLFASA